MKTSTIAITLSALIAVAMLSSLILPRGEAILKARITWKPNKYTLDTTVVHLWNATIVGVDPTLIDPASIHAVGETAGTPIHPVSGQVILAGKDRFVANFLGTDVRNLIWEIVLYHDLLSAPGRYRINIIVYGTYMDGVTQWQGVKSITVIIPVPPPPPPP